MSLHAEQFFTQAFPHRLDGAVVGNSFYAASPPGSQLRLRIDFYETIYQHKYGGLRLTVLHPDKGTVDVIALSFKDHGTFRERDTTRTYDQGFVHAGLGGTEPPWKGGDFTHLAQAVRTYARMWGFPASEPTVRSAQRAASLLPAPSRVRGTAARAR
ncbi:hypothetical protein [Streptomyces uncialis]|uniref:hypothetical protein n=1 Tax=Streptomyces uncialis TaxID=1048205 RepID=UPI0038683E73|nr:hypothetical protein OG924_29745 [Streptomyces uncialis]